MLFAQALRRVEEVVDVDSLAPPDQDVVEPRAHHPFANQHVVLTSYGRADDVEVVEFVGAC